MGWEATFQASGLSMSPASSDDRPRWLLRLGNRIEIRVCTPPYPHSTRFHTWTCASTRGLQPPPGGSLLSASRPPQHGEKAADEMLHPDEHRFLRLLHDYLVAAQRERAADLLQQPELCEGEGRQQGLCVSIDRALHLPPAVDLDRLVADEGFEQEVLPLRRRHVSVRQARCAPQRAPVVGILLQQPP